jgi:hypothetical protein
MPDDDEFNFAHGEMFVKAIRSSGYKNAAMALGELIDNSLQAKATNVDVLVSEKFQMTGNRNMWAVNEIAILDDGEGMDADLLRRSLKLGDGSSFNKVGGMGKFGVGLPQASVSQAKRVDVWSWQDGVDSALHTYIDLSDDEWVKNMKIPVPTSRPIPTKWMDESTISGESGTLVVWSKVDRLKWKKAKSIYDHSNYLIGRMYRNWLSTEKAPGKEDWPSANIQLVSFDEDNTEWRPTWKFTANDPLYLLTDTSAPNTIPGREMIFEQWGQTIDKKYSINHDDGTRTEETVSITFTLAPKLLRSPLNSAQAGTLDYGKHAKNNIGVSIVREGRELELDKSFGIKRDPRNRWWGCQVEFGRGMDDVFNVTNNKQHAEDLTDAANRDWEDEAEEGESDQQTRDRLKVEDFPTFICLDVALEISKNITNIMKVIAKDKAGTKKRTRHADSPERKGTEATKKRIEDTGKEGESDGSEGLSDAEKKDNLKGFLLEKGVEEGDIIEITGDIIDSGLKYSIADAPMSDSPSFFTVDSEAGAVIITLNRSHAAYGKLFSTLNCSDYENKTSQELHQMLMSANSALLLMLIGWARLEDEARGKSITRYKDTRNEWGTITRDFLSFGEED